jgi:hypothetical protein
MMLRKVIHIPVVSTVIQIHMDMIRAMRAMIIGSTPISFTTNNAALNGLI